MEDVTNEFGLNIEDEKEAEEKAQKVIRSLGMDESEEKTFLDYLSNGRGSEEEEAYFEQRYAKTRSLSRSAVKYSDSPLVKYTCLSPNCNSPRVFPIDTITIHEVWGECSMQALGAIFKPSSRQASSNYGCCTDGVALFVHERDRAWTSGSPANDNRAVTIEVSNSRTYPNAVSSGVYNQLIELCADICRRNGKTKMVWCGSLSATNARKFASNEMRMTLHKWFQATDCPGNWLENHMQEIANKVNAKLAPKVYPEVPFTVKVLVNDLNIRKTATIDGTSNVIGTATKGNHVVEKVKNDMGYIGNGWIYLANEDYVKVGETVAKSIFTDVATDAKYYDVYKTVAEAGIMKANSKGKFLPNKKVTRGMLAIVVYRLLKKMK